jgi:uncharacterized membrane protein YeaQ/YmgE (transglycosylase-associated protein family)
MDVLHHRDYSRIDITPLSEFAALCRRTDFQGVAALAWPQLSLIFWSALAIAPFDNRGVIMRFYRTWVLACVAAWFLVGLHVPVMHEVTHHGQALPASVLGAVVLLVLVGIAGLWRLLRAPAPGSGAGT